MTRTLEVRTLREGEAEEAIAFLQRDALENLFLLDLVARHGQPPSPGEMRTEIGVATCGGDLVGVAALRPTIVFDAGMVPEVAQHFLPYIDSLNVGLVKSAAGAADVVWAHLSGSRGRRAIVDRHETAYALRAREASLVRPAGDRAARSADPGDLEPLVFAARESLREEDRPDPFAGDVRLFRRWVRGRVPRARVVDSSGRVVFVGYADVQRGEGWLLQGIYTWPEARRRGFAATGTSDLCRLAFDRHADHVQLAVVEGNEAARSLYEGLGFKPFARLRTILFH